MVVYHLHGKTVWFMVWAIGKYNSILRYSFGETNPSHLQRESGIDIKDEV